MCRQTQGQAAESNKKLLPEYIKWGQTLDEDESVEMKVAEKKPVYLTLANKRKLETFSEVPYEDHVTIKGEVFETDVKKGRFQLSSDEDTTVAVNFTPEQEDQVTTALKDHRTVQLFVKGSGEFSPQGKPIRILKVDELRLTEEEEGYDRNAQPIEEVLSDLAKEIPQEEWDKLPKDLNDNLDHYLYGVPKK